MGHCILTINDNVILDASGESNTGNFDADENILYDVKIEYFSVSIICPLTELWFHAM